MDIYGRLLGLFLAVMLGVTACGLESPEDKSASAERLAQPQSSASQPRSQSPSQSQPQPPPAPKSPWKSLQQDGLHDPNNPALPLLQQPEEALSVLPGAPQGNNVDWVMALRSGAITPRTNIFPETKVRILDLDVIMKNTAGMPMVRFPHRPHTEWLDCSNCHEKIFRSKRGANRVSMKAILDGEFCGQCHGAVSFPLTQCKRCHSVPRTDAENR